MEAPRSQLTCTSQSLHLHTLPSQHSFASQNYQPSFQLQARTHKPRPHPRVWEGGCPEPPCKDYCPADLPYLPSAHPAHSQAYRVASGSLCVCPSSRHRALHGVHAQECV